MFKKLLLLSVVFLSVISATESYACGTEGCQGYAYGPVVGAFVDGTDTMYIGTAIRDTSTTDASIKSGADDDTCHDNDYILGSHWEMISPFGVDANGVPTESARAHSQAILDMLRMSQKVDVTPQIMLIFYTWSNALSSCVITGVGYYNG